MESGSESTRSAPPQLRVLSSRENRLLGRMELEYLIEGASGRLSRADLARLVAGQLSASPEAVVPVRMSPVTGTGDLVALVYVYSDPAEARRQLPEHLFLRMMGKEERARAIEERRKARAAQRAKSKAKG
ncbi:MAG: hypothetical protein ACP5NG_02025 [Conexivisphaera sp.]